MQSKMDNITTKNLGKGNHEVIPVEMGTGEKNYDKLNMEGGSNVKIVGNSAKKE